MFVSFGSCLSLRSIGVFLVRTAWAVRDLEPDDVQSLAAASCTFSLWSEQLHAANAEATGDEADMVHAFFTTLTRPDLVSGFVYYGVVPCFPARQRVLLLKAIEATDAEERNKCFSFILGGAMGAMARDRWLHAKLWCSARRGWCSHGQLLTNCN